MKTIIIALFGVLLLSSAAFAVNDDSDVGALNIGGGVLTVGDDAGEASPDLTIGLSPKVFARYLTDGDTETTAQWYAIATVHPGGNVGYATAQDVNNIYMKEFITGDVTTTITATIQEEKLVVAADDTAEAIAAAQAAQWEGLGWSTSAPN
jgi:hypothetical protein